MFEQLRIELRKLMNDRADDLATGAAQDYAAYQFIVGQINGLAQAERLILDVLDKIERIDA